MKKFLTAAICVLAVCACISSGCKGGKNAFAFISVRMKGNGDGTVSAVAQNEFSLFSDKIPVTLSLYCCEEYTTDTEKMTLVSRTESEGLGAYKTLDITWRLTEESYLLARLDYSVNGDKKFILRDSVLYGADGKRK